MFQNTLLSDVLSCFKVTSEGASLYFGPTLTTPSYGGSTDVVSFADPVYDLFSNVHPFSMYSKFLLTLSMPMCDY